MCICVIGSFARGKCKVSWGEWVGYTRAVCWQGREDSTHPSTPEGGKGMEWVYSGKIRTTTGLEKKQIARQAFLLVEIASLWPIRARCSKDTRAFVYLHPVSAVIRNVLPRRPRRPRRPCGLGASAGNKGAVVHISCDPDTRELVSVICGATEQCPFLSRAGLSMVADVSRLVFPGIQLHVLRGKCRD